MACPGKRAFALFCCFATTGPGTGQPFLILDICFHKRNGIRHPTGEILKWPLGQDRDCSSTGDFLFGHQFAICDHLLLPGLGLQCSGEFALFENNFFQNTAGAQASGEHYIAQRERTLEQFGIHGERQGR